MENNFVALTGTKGGPAIRPGSSMPTSNLLCLDGQQIVVDCGLGVTRGLVDQGMQLRDLDTIFITHLHSDHYLELGGLLHTAWTAGLKTPVQIWGPAGLEQYWQNFVASMQFDIDTRIDDEGRPDLGDLVTFHVLGTDRIVLKGGISVSTLRNAHPPLLDSFALAFRSTQKTVVFSGDTAPIAEMVDFAKGADILIHEAMLKAALPALMARVGNGSEKLMAHLLRSHTCAHDAAKIAESAGVKQLALSHLVPSDDPDYTKKDWENAVKDHWDGPLHIGFDGIRIFF
ncbi:hydrolase [Amylibacter marinus]|uniref:Hydrolase n=1 Tax=Amylibacter marinus TaxID=1475483 RepID=A0ABQ5VVD1_9RHOB|nr:MBL fold metallo-hydrolase [Amylibacter marinus]GLQ35166.1 hydrolase [Amylibacter marinus]